jgi:hypothetical protein
MDQTQHSGKNILDIMASPHTKCFLLLQAFIFKSKLPKDLKTSIFKAILFGVQCKRALDAKIDKGLKPVLKILSSLPRIVR